MGNGRVEGTSSPARRWRQWTPEEAAQILAEWKSSGRSLAAFARERGLTVQRLYWWRARIGGELRGRRRSRAIPSSAHLVPAVITGAPLVAAAVTVRAVTGESVEISEPSSVPPEWVAALVKAISSASR